MASYNHYSVNGGRLAQGGTGPVWTGSFPEEDGVELNEFFQSIAPDMPERDLKFLLTKISESESAQRGLQNVILKLKLEFGDELGAENARLDADAKARQKAKVQNEKRRKMMARQSQQQLDEMVTKHAEWAQRLRNLSYHMDTHDVYGKSDVPKAFLDVYQYCQDQNYIRRFLGFGRPYIVVTEIKNPFDDDVNHAKQDIRANLRMSF